jgi:chitinase
MIGGQNFRSAIIPELPSIPTVSQQEPYVNDLINMGDIVALYKLFCLDRLPAIVLL